MHLRALARRLRKALRKVKPRPAILMYHRVAPVELDPWDITVSPKRFEQQIAFLARHRKPLPMEELVRRFHDATLPANAIGVTFDDGYRDNLVVAKPILEKYGVPATVFIATGYVGRVSPFWWDELGNMILTEPDPLDHAQVCGEVQVNLKWGMPEKADADRTWRGWDPPRSARQSCFQRLWGYLQSASDTQRTVVMDAIRSILKMKADPLSLPMNRQEVAELIKGGLITVGAHTVTHPALTDLDREARWAEITLSGEQCFELVGHEVPGFAYPYGNFDERVCEDLVQSRFSWACTTEGFFLGDERPNLFTLPRLTACEAPMSRFKHLLSPRE